MSSGLLASVSVARTHASRAVLAVALCAARSLNNAMRRCADHTLRRFRDDAKHAADASGFDAHRVVRDVEIRFLLESVPFHLEQQVFRPEGFAGADDAGEQVVQHALPDFTPRLSARQT